MPEEPQPTNSSPIEEPVTDPADVQNVAPQSQESGEQQEPTEELTPEELEGLRANEVAYSWQASEYVHHRKGPGWYAGLLGVVIVLVVGAALLHYWLEIGAFLVMGVAILVYARKPPRTLMYELTPKGINIEGKFHPYAEFRSFAVLPDLEWHSINLEPVKRFSPPLAVLFDSDDFDQIVGHLELHLSREDRQPDIIDRLSRYLRF